MTKTYTFVTEFRGNTYCSQVQAADVTTSVEQWLTKAKEDKIQVQHLGDKTLEELSVLVESNLLKPVLLTGLHNAWQIHLPTKRGAFNMNIIQTDISK